MGPKGKSQGKSKNQLGRGRTGVEVSLASGGAPLEAGSGMVWEGSCQAKDEVKLKRIVNSGDLALPHTTRQEPREQAKLWAEKL